MKNDCSLFDNYSGLSDEWRIGIEVYEIRLYEKQTMNLKGTSVTFAGILTAYSNLGPIEMNTVGKGPKNNITLSNISVKGTVPPLRQAYIDEVKGLKQWVTAMRGQGNTSEQIARAVHLRRRLLGIECKLPLFSYHSKLEF